VFLRRVGYSYVPTFRKNYLPPFSRLLNSVQLNSDLTGYPREESSVIPRVKAASFSLTSKKDFHAQSKN
jgi:hypothetical protein